MPRYSRWPARSGRVLRRDQTLAWASASVAGVAKDASAIRHTGRPCGL